MSACFCFREAVTGTLHQCDHCKAKQQVSAPMPERVWVTVLGTPAGHLHATRAPQARLDDAMPYVPESRLLAAEARVREVEEELARTRMKAIYDVEAISADREHFRAERECLVPLARLGLDALEVYRQGTDYECADIQDHALAIGVVHPVPVDPTWRCQMEGTCECEPGTDCYRDTATTTQARALLAREGT